MLFPKPVPPKPKAKRGNPGNKGSNGVPMVHFVAALFEANSLLPEEKKHTDFQLAFQVEVEFWDHYYPNGEPSKAARERTLDNIHKMLWPWRYKFNQGCLYKGQVAPAQKSVAYDSKGLPVRYGDISSLEAKFIEGWLEHAYTGFLGPEREVFFHPTRRWRIDFAWVPLKVGVEIQGGTWAAKSRHNSGSGLASCYEKLNEAQRLGWILLQMDAKYLTKANIKGTIEYVCDILGDAGKRNPIQQSLPQNEISPE